MKILVLTNLFPNPYQPNRAPWNRQQFEAVAKEHEVRVIAPILWTDEWREWRKQGRKIDSTRRVERGSMVVEHPRYYYTPKILRGMYGRFFEMSARSTFLRVVKEFCPDLVFGSWAYPDGWAAVQLAKTDSVPVVVKVHGSDVLSLRSEPARKAGTLEALKDAAGIIAVSQHLANELEELGFSKKRIRVVYNGVDASLFQRGDQSAARQRLGLNEQPMVLFAGNLAPVKQVHILLDAIAAAKKSKPELQCHLLGDGPLRSTLEAQAHKLSLQDSVTFHGVVSHDSLPTWYQAADLVALPSKSEGVPNVLLEAMSCGTPFVASNVGGIPEITPEESCALVTPGNASEFSKAMLQVLANPSQPKFERSIDQSASDLIAAIEGFLAGA